MRGVYQTNMDLGILQGKKVIDRIYTRRSDGYSVITTDAPIRHLVGVAVFHQPEPHYAVEALQQFVPNAVGVQLATGERWWYIVGC